MTKKNRARIFSKREIRASTICMNRMSKEQIMLWETLYPRADHWRPITRADCAKVERPCPFVTCKYNLYLDVVPLTGNIKMNFPDLEPHEMAESCVLDITDRGEITLEKVGDVMNLTRERARQIELMALAKMADCEEFGLRDFA